MLGKGQSAGRRVNPEKSHDPEHESVAALRAALRETEQKLRATQTHLDQARTQAATQRTILNTIVEQLPVGVLVTGADGSQILQNAHMRSLSLPATASQPPASAATSNPPPSQVADESPLARALQTRAPQPPEEVLIYDEQAGRRWVRLSALPILTSDGTLLGAAALSEDVTARRRAESDLRARDDFRLRVLDKLIAFVGVLELDGTLIEANQAPLRAAQITEADVIGKKFWDCHWWAYTPAAQAGLRAAFDEAKRGGTVRYDTQVRMAADRIMWIDFQLSPLRDDNGRITHLIASAIDIAERKRAEDALRRGEKRFRTLADAMPQLVWTADKDGNVTYYNAKSAQYSGITRGPDGTWNWRPIVHPDDLAGTLRAWQTALEQGGEYVFEHRVQMRDGEYRWHLSRAVWAPELDGTGGAWYGTATDVHDLKLAQQHLDLALEAGGMGTWDLHLDENRVFWDERQRALWGFHLPDQPNNLQFVFAAIHPDDRAAVEEMCRQTASGELPSFESEFRIELPDGTHRWLAGTGTRVGSDRLIGVNYDVTARKRAEKRLRESEERFRSTFENAAVGIAHIAPDGSWLRVNRRLCTIVGRPPGQLYHQSFHDLTHADDRTTVQTRFAELMRGEYGRYQQEHRLIHRSGATVWVELTAAVHTDTAGRPEYCIAVIQDISDRKQLEQERDDLLERERAARAITEQVSRAKDEFLSVINHELRSPVATVLGWARILEEGELTPDAREAVDAILRGSGQLKQLIDDLLDVTRVANGKFKLSLSRTDLAALVDETASDFQLAANEKQVTLQTQLPDEPCYLHGDAGRLRQLLSNLLSNAIKFTPAGGTVTVRVESEPNQRTLIVEDTGVGVASDLLPHLFERFRQADSTVARQYQGLGLGLTLVKQIAELHGGSVCASSDGPDSGTRFTVTLPNSPAPLTYSEQRLDGINAVVVDDDPGTLGITTRLLENAGAAVVRFDSGRAARDYLQRELPDVLLCDISMPDIDGYTLIRSIRNDASARASTVPAIAVTAFAREIDEQRSLEAGFHAHESKPLDSSRLYALIYKLTQDN